MEFDPESVFTPRAREEVQYHRIAEQQRHLDGVQTSTTHTYPVGDMNVIQEIKRINERELEQGVSGKASWHYEYKDSAWVFAGGFSYDLTEGDILCVMSQWGEIEDINLCREKDTGKSKVLDVVGQINLQRVRKTGEERDASHFVPPVSSVVGWQCVWVGFRAFRLLSDTTAVAAAAHRLCPLLLDC